MRWQSFILTALIFLSGCGFNAEEPVYDTAKNPDGFPQKALQMLDDVQSGKLEGFDAIAGAFGDLYTENTELLDSQPWRAVIDRLGSKFSYTADTLRKKGIESYRAAAEYYQLASFARPEDKHLYQRALTFDTWRKAFDNGFLDLAAVVDSADVPLSKYLEVARYFVFGADPRREFYKDNLKIEIVDRLKKSGLVTPQALESLDAADRCLVAYLGLSDEHDNSPLASFENPSIDLAACQITQIDSTSYIAEAYIIPHEKVSGDLTVAVRMSMSDSSQPSGLNYSQLQLRPEQPSSEWKSGGLLAAARQFDLPVPPGALQVSVIDRSEGRAKYLEMADGAGSFYKLDDSALITF